MGGFRASHVRAAGGDIAGRLFGALGTISLVRGGQSSGMNHVLVLAYIRHIRCAFGLGVGVFSDTLLTIPSRTTEIQD